MSDLEKLLRELLEKTQQASDLSRQYPNPYSGIPSRLTSALIETVERIKFAIGEVVAADVRPESGENDSSS